MRKKTTATTDNWNITGRFRTGCYTDSKPIGGDNVLLELRCECQRKQKSERRRGRRSKTSLLCGRFTRFQRWQMIGQPHFGRILSWYDLNVHDMAEFRFLWDADRPPTSPEPPGPATGRRAANVVVVVVVAASTSGANVANAPRSRSPA